MNNTRDMYALSWKAQGILRCIHEAEDKHLSIDEIVSSARDGRSAVMKGIKELEIEGWLKREKKHDGRMEYILI
jgi:predicted transcriptional regulator